MLTNKQIYGGKPATVEIRRKDTGEVVYHSHRANETTKSLLETCAGWGRMQFCDITNADLTGAKLARGILKLVDFDGSDFTDADLTGCNLYGCKLRDVNFTRVTLIGADLRAVEFRPLPGTFDPRFSFGVEPDPTLPARVAEAFLNQDPNSDTEDVLLVGGLVIAMSGPAAQGLLMQTSMSIATAILMPAGVKIYDASWEEQTRWCRGILRKKGKGRKEMARA